MAIRPPSWCSDAVPTDRGWTHPRTGELLKAVKIKPHMIEEWFASQSEEETKVEIVMEPVIESPLFEDEIVVESSFEEEIEPLVVEIEEEIMEDTQMEMLTEAPANNKSLDEMTKRELEDLGRQHGVELDRRKNKKTLIETMKSLIG